MTRYKSVCDKENVVPLSKFVSIGSCGGGDE